MLHTFALSAVPKNLSGFGVGEFDLEGKTSPKLDLMEEKLNCIRSSHAQGGKDSFRLGFDGGSDPGPNGGSL